MNGVSVAPMTFPSNPTAFNSPSRSTHFVEFNVPSSQLRVHDIGNGWARVFGPGSIEARLATSRGLTAPTKMPPATSIRLRTTR